MKPRGMGQCSRCEAVQDRPGQRLCKLCHASNMRYWRKTHDMTPMERKKANCRSYTKVYVKRGAILKSPCEVCGSPKSEAHHPDYDRPKLVVWLCRFHHLELHKSEQRFTNVSRGQMHIVSR